MTIEAIYDKPQPPPLKSITLSLTRDEARVLKSVFGKIGGEGPVRNITSNIYYALERLGITDAESRNLHTGGLTAKGSF